MDKRDNQGPGNDAAPGNNNGHGRKEKGPSLLQPAKNAILSGNDKLMEQVRQIISETPEIRPEKVVPLQEAVEQGTYGIDVRNLANILIIKLFLDS
jgi:anti-sigma28 factor (negative regulator of flagellin synthesis)